MSGSSFGTLFKITSWGESHGPALGVTIDGCPAGLPLSPDIIQPYMDRRKPGQTRYSTPRREADEIEILSGIFERRTTGTPITIMVRNTSQRSADYGEIASCYRPGHADYSFDAKYGFRDYRGGGRSSGRETIARVAAGAVASALLAEFGIEVMAYTAAIGPVELPAQNLVPNSGQFSGEKHTAGSAYITREKIMASPLYMPDAAASEAAEIYLEQKMKEQDSVGGIVECRITGCPAGLGEPVFDKLDASLAKAVMSIGAVKGVEIGDGFAAARHTGSENNDAFDYVNGSVCKKTNHAGGILGGISDGSPIFLRAAIKATPSISCPQETINTAGKPITISVKGRHDPVIVPRAVVVVESMAAITVCDLLLQNAASRLDNLKKIYNIPADL